MADVAHHNPEQNRNVFLSRALAALAVKALANVDAATAAKAVTDGYNDNGIDAIHFDQQSDSLLIVQSKWSNDGNSSFDAKATLAMAQGVKDLLNARFERFNDKTKSREAEIRAALYAPGKIVLVTAHTAVQAIAAYVQRNVDELVEDLNKAVVQAESKHFNQAGVYELLAAESVPQKIQLQISLREWGKIEKPFQAFYGRVHANEISGWWKEHGNALFSQNLRFFLYLDSDVNDALSRTLAENPDFFWYFNNGITVICDTVDKTLAGSPGREIGLFKCAGANIVNGAQTVGTVGGKWTVADDSAETWIQVRIISLAHCPPDFSKLITRATNHQNVVGNREFASMDAQQHRLATEFVLDRRRYAYRQGEPKPHGNEGCDIEEATVAVACDTSVALAVECKRRIGTIWANTETAPYTEIFNTRTTSARVWRLVQIMRAVDDELHKVRITSAAPRGDLIGVHLNRIMLHLVLTNPALQPLKHEGASEGDCLARAREIARDVFSDVAAYMEDHHRDEYPAAFSKNTSRCEALVKSLRSQPKPPKGPAGEWEPQGLFK